MLRRALKKLFVARIGPSWVVTRQYDEETKLAVPNFDEEKRSRRQVNLYNSQNGQLRVRGLVSCLSSLARCKGQGRASSLCLMAACLNELSAQQGLNLTCDSDPRLRRREFALPLRGQSKRA
jgi:hypothetical protein